MKRPQKIKVMAKAMVMIVVIMMMTTGDDAATKSR